MKEPRHEEIVGATSRKQVYRTPALQVYGTLSALTATVSKVLPTPDGGMGAMSKTA
jgi:hypothetical protein